MTSILKSISSGFETNISKDEISNLIQMQLTDMATWNVNSISVNGTGAYRPTYTFGAQNLYVMIPKQETIQSAKKAIDNILIVNEDTNKELE